jgi:3D-(3,5/4)-trihydroxycyclohexane-1,2-dione acylhydrolase (decyclizing)
VVLIQNHGFASIGALSESLGSQRFGTRYRMRNPETALLDGAYVPVDLATNAESLGADVLRVNGIDEFRIALTKAKAATRTTVVYVETDPLAPVPSSQSWWDVPVSEVAAIDTTIAARVTYDEAKRSQRTYL